MKKTLLEWYDDWKAGTGGVRGMTNGMGKTPEGGDDKARLAHEAAERGYSFSLCVNLFLHGQEKSPLKEKTLRRGQKEKEKK